jgi:hypothetical protein
MIRVLGLTENAFAPEMKGLRLSKAGTLWVEYWMSESKFDELKVKGFALEKL